MVLSWGSPVLHNGRRTLFSADVIGCNPGYLSIRGTGPSSEVELSLMVRWVVGSILHGMDPLNYFSFQPVLHDWCNKGCGVLSCLRDDAYKIILATNRK